MNKLPVASASEVPKPQMKSDSLCLTIIIFIVIKTRFLLGVRLLLARYGVQGLAQRKKSCRHGF